MRPALAPPIPYFGGKQRIASQIVATFAPHKHYIEPYAGSLSVLLAKPPVTFETVNDLDKHLVTFWRVLRDRPDDLHRAASLTPHSRAEMVAARKIPDGTDELEIARRVWVELTQSRAGLRASSGWRYYLDADTSTTSLPGYLDGYRGRMHPAAARLAHVSLENRDALDVIADYGQAPTSLLYVDPPYLPTTRTSGKYRHEVDHAHHKALLSALLGCKAHVALSGYRSDLYDEALTGWHVTSIAATTQQANKVGANRRTEVVWTNYEPHATLLGATS